MPLKNLMKHDAVHEPAHPDADQRRGGDEGPGVDWRTFHSRLPCGRGVSGAHLAAGRSGSAATPRFPARRTGPRSAPGFARRLRRKRSRSRPWTWAIRAGGRVRLETQAGRACHQDRQQPPHPGNVEPSRRRKSQLEHRLCFWSAPLSIHRLCAPDHPAGNRHALASASGGMTPTEMKARPRRRGPGATRSPGCTASRRRPAGSKTWVTPLA